jgi:hypothetical protein
VSDDVGAIVENPRVLDGFGADNLVAIATSFDASNDIPLKVLSLDRRCGEDIRVTPESTIGARHRPVEPCRAFHM